MARATTVRAPASTRPGSRRSSRRSAIQCMSAAWPAASQRSRGPASSASARASPTSGKPLERAAAFTAARGQNEATGIHVRKSLPSAWVSTRIVASRRRCGRGVSC